jgi:hypothetical protein
MAHQALSIPLELLLHELPDPDQDPAFQQCDKLRLTLFSAFPLELRRIIWTRALPKPRRVCLYVCQSHYQQPNSRPLPATLHAYQESRQVTLENYVITLYPPEPGIKDVPAKRAGKHEDKREQGLEAWGKSRRGQVKFAGGLKSGSEDKKCIPLGRMVFCFDPVRDSLYLDIRTPFDPIFKNTTAELQRASPRSSMKVLRMEIVNASLLIIGEFQYLTWIGDDLRV